MDTSGWMALSLNRRPWLVNMPRRCAIRLGAGVANTEMRISIDHERPTEGPGSGPVTVGWLRDVPKGGVIQDPPERLVSRDVSRTHAKSASRCPAMIQMESRYFQISCPIDLRIGFSRDAQGKPVLVNRAGAASSIRGAKRGTLLTLVNEAEWRHPERTTVQLSLPYIFLADEPVYITQLVAAGGTLVLCSVRSG